jgi:acyl-CoA synthetase (AMP-forming)/AMP-acid ligase II
MNLIDYLGRNARNFPQRAACRSDGSSWTYAQLNEMALRTAHGLKAFGVERETPCAVISRNHVLGFTALLGILKARGAWVPLNTGNAEEDHLYVLEHFDVHVLFFQREFEDFAQRVRERVPNVKHFVCVDGPSAMGSDMSAWMAQQPADDLPLPWDPDGMCMLRGTGGTTGRPKGVINTNRNFEVTVANYMARMRFETPPVYLAAAPLSHAAAVFAFINMAMGGTMVILPKFDAGNVLSTIESEQVSFIYLPPTAVYSLLSHPAVENHDYSSMRYFLYGAAPMSAAKLAEAIRRFGRVMTQAYGQTEAPAGITFLGPEEHFDADGNIDHKKLLSCGRADPFTRVALMDDEGNFVPRGEVGEIVVQGGIVMRGYYKNPQATAEVSRFGWHHTGDVAYEDEDGYYYICDRKKEMIISGGFNVYPLEVEQVILAHPGVQDCAVVGVPDEKWGEAVKAVVELKAGAQAEAQELIAMCRERLGGVKTPKTVEFVETLPRSSVGKVMRRAVRDKYWVGHERRV